MDDLIKMLEAKIIDVENANGPAKHILNDRLADLGQVAWDYGDEILSALKTVRGIEGLAKGEWVVKISEPLQDARNERENQWLVEIGRKCFYGSTLPLAVEAAVGANEKGEK